MGKQKTGITETYSLTIKATYFQNIEQIVIFIAFKKKQPLNAIKVGEGIHETMLKIKNNTLIYSVCENLPTKTKIYREARYKTWLIIFKVKNWEVIILGVLSSKQKPTSFKKIVQ